MGIQYNPRIVTDGLVLALDAGNTKSYPGSGTTWTDLSGNNNTGTLTNGQTYSSANGGSIVFDGSYDYVSFNNLGAFTSLTICGWFRQLAIGNQKWIGLAENDNTKVTWIGSGNGGANSEWDFGFNGNDRNNLETTGNLWNYYSIVYDGSTNQSGYRNAVLKSSSTITQFNYVNSKLNVGKRAWADSGYFNGNIAQVQIYNRALTAAEVSQNFNALRSRFSI
jgi:hypothetical protein